MKHHDALHKIFSLPKWPMKLLTEGCIWNYSRTDQPTRIQSDTKSTHQQTDACWVWVKCSRWIMRLWLLPLTVTEASVCRLIRAFYTQCAKHTHTLLCLWVSKCQAIWFMYFCMWNLQQRLSPFVFSSFISHFCLIVGVFLIFADQI